MNLKVRVRYLKDIDIELVRRLVQYKSAEQYVEIDAETFTEEQLTLIFDRATEDKGAEGARGLCQRIKQYRAVQSNPTGSKITRLEMLAAALRSYIEPTPNKWVFLDDADGSPLPYYVSYIEFEKARPRENRAARVEVRLAAVGRNKQTGNHLYFHFRDLGGTVSEVLNAAGYYLENPTLVEQFWADIEQYKKCVPLTGMQYKCVGTGYGMSGYGYDRTAMEREGVPATVVMDDLADEGGNNRREDSSKGTSPSTFWKTAAKEDDDLTGSDTDTVAVPVHPYVKVFDLARHQFMRVHIRHLSPYVYDESAADKLVLNSDTKDLIHILVEGSAEVMEDIIQGKTGGTIVISTGPPGTGKTLTAEVFSEKIRCPLYVVQCSQLGTDEEQVEKQLQKVLARATRWKAILLIDEADVYVHTRGTDIQQNAIVGVFLRVLEHYRGVLFLTSNRSTIIDDAIMSRATAWIRYEYPMGDQLTEIWKVLSAQYKMDLSAEVIAELVAKFPRLSGRNIKNLLKLATMLLRRNGKKPELATFQYVATFLDLKLDDKEPG